jgi:hypothetical protein
MTLSSNIHQREIVRASIREYVSFLDMTGPVKQNYYGKSV